MNQEHDYRLWHPRGYLALLYYAFFDWHRFPETKVRSQQIQLIIQALFVTTLSTFIIAHICQLLGYPVNWSRLALGVTFGMIYGIILIKAYGVALGIAYGVSVAVMGGVSGGFVGGVARGVVRDMAVGVAVGVARRVAVGVTIGVAVGLAAGAAVGVEESLSSSWGSTLALSIGLTAGIAVAAIGFFLTSVTAALIILPFEDRGSNNVKQELWIGMGILIPFSILFGYLMFWLEPWLEIGANSPWWLALAFALAFSRLPIWPLESVWIIGCWRWSGYRRDSVNEEYSVQQQIQQLRRIYFDRHIWLPLPGEARSLQRLIAVDEDAGIREAIYTACHSNHILNSVKALHNHAKQNPLLVQTHLRRVSNENVSRNLVRYTAHSLPDVASRVWVVQQQLEQLSQQLQPDESQVTANRSQLLGHMTQLLESDQAGDESTLNLAQVITQLRKSVTTLGAVEQLEDFPYVKTHHALYSAMTAGLEFSQANDIGQYDMPRLPAAAPLLYPESLHQMLAQLDEIAARLRGYATATSPVTRSQHLLEAQELLEKAGQDVEHVPTPPGPFLALIIAHWRRLTAEAGGQLVRGQQVRPIAQPYVIANPVIGHGFVGRDDIMRRLESLWAVKGQRPSVVLYGHRRMGKSSILQNLQGKRFDPNTRIVDFNLQTYGLVPHSGVLLHNLALALYDDFRSVEGMGMATQSTLFTEIFTEPAADNFTTDDPYSEFNRFLQRLNRVRGELRFIVTLDEFETIEERIRSGRFNPNLIDYLRGVITTQPWLTLAFAGLHTLQEMTTDYWHPLFGSVETLPVSFLTEGAMRRLLTAPRPDFAVDYDQDALDAIYRLTRGQPYLTQLIGHGLVDRLNQQMFEEQVERELRFTLADVAAIIDTPDFYRTGGAYFQGIWAQASEYPPGQQMLLQLLAPGPVTTEALVQGSGFAFDEVSAALATLEQHDVLYRLGEVDREEAIRLADEWGFSVELMRRWVERQGKGAGLQGGKKISPNKFGV